MPFDTILLVRKKEGTSAVRSLIAKETRHVRTSVSIRHVEVPDGAERLQMALEILLAEIPLPKGARPEKEPEKEHQERCEEFCNEDET